MVMHKEQVSIVRVEEQNTYDALKRAVDLIGGIEKLIRPNSSILIKPNIVMGPTERKVTDPVVLEAVLKLIVCTSPKEVVVGEGSADSYTSSAFRIYNIYDIASRYGARVVDLNLDEGVQKKVPVELGREYVMVPRTAAEADFVVSVPTFKLWMNTLPMSLSLKNLFGLYGAKYYGHNKNSRELIETDPGRTLSGEIGTERGIHFPSVEQSIAAINFACPSDLTVIDALEGSDGKGNYVRMDMIMAGRNAVATDSVALAVAGFAPEEQEQIKLASHIGLGPSDLETIEVVGEPIESVRFDLTDLLQNVLELPFDFCMDRLTKDELGIVFRGLQMQRFLPDGEFLSSERHDLSAQLLEVLRGDGFIGKALDCIPETGKAVLELIADRGGTSGDYFDILDTYTSKTGESNSFWAGLRSLMRLALAFIFHGQHKPYIVLAKGVVQAARDRGILHSIAKANL